MEYNELRDIMLEKDEEKKSKSAKKILILVAVFAIVFISVLIAMKFLNTTDSGGEIAQVDSRLVLPPEPDPAQNQIAQNQVQPSTPTAQTPTPPPSAQQQPAQPEAQKNDGLFQQVPIIPENKGQDSFEDMVKTLKDKENKGKTEQPTQPESQNNVVAQTPSESNQAQTQKAPEPAKAQNKPSQTKPKSEQKVVVVKPKENKPQPKQPEQKIVKAQPAKPKDSAVKAQSLPSGSYIQVFAVKNFNENVAEIKKIKANGYNYKLYNVVVNGANVTKVLIGPYSGKELATELPKIKKNVASGAFIISVK